MSYGLAIWFAGIVVLVSIATEIAIRFRSSYAVTSNVFVRNLLRVFNSHSRIDALDRQLRQALDTTAGDVKNVTKNNEMVVAALKPIEVALRTFSSRLNELDGKVDATIRRHSLRDSRAEKRLATQMGWSEEVDSTLSVLADQVATLQTFVEGISARVAEASALVGTLPQCEQGSEQITSGNPETAIEQDDRAKADSSQPGAQLDAQESEALLTELESRFARRLTRLESRFIRLNVPRKKLRSGPRTPSRRQIGRT